MRAGAWDGYWGFPFEQHGPLSHRLVGDSEPAHREAERAGTAQRSTKRSSTEDCGSGQAARAGERPHLYLTGMAHPPRSGSSGCSRSTP